MAKNLWQKARVTQVLTGGMHCICGEPIQCRCHWPRSGRGGGTLPSYRFYCPRCAGEQSTDKPLAISYDQQRDVLLIDGIRYSGALFRGMASAFTIDRWFKIVSRHDGVITIKSAPAGARIAWEEMA